MFIDASAIVAILIDEPPRHELVATMKSQSRLVTSAIAVWETVVRLMRKTNLSHEEASERVDAFMNTARVALVEIAETEARLSTQAFARYGKGRHPAALNMGDCFAYACAKSHQVPLLYVGNDFSQTDINQGFKTLN